jgi:glycosyltransferase involved in cell wall biosynthesis
MKVLFDHNEPFLLAHGGFQILIEKTAEALRKEGIEVEYLRWWDPDQKGDLVHFFGRANPGNIHFAQQKGMRYVMHELLTSQGSRTKSQILLQGLANRSIGRLLPAAFRQPLRWESYRKADAVLASTTWEAWIMCKLFPVENNKLHVIPTGVDDCFFRKAQLHSTKPEFFNEKFWTERLVCLATITERKRTIELAEASISAGVPLSFIGAPYSNRDLYFLKFLEIVERSKGLITHHSDLSAPGKLAPVLQASRGFVLLSTMETQSTAALAAAAAGCPLLLSDLHWAHATFGDRATYVRNLAPEALANSLKSFHTNAPNLPRPASPPTWSDVAKQLLRVYGSLTSYSRVSGSEASP